MLRLWSRTESSAAEPAVPDREVGRDLIELRGVTKEYPTVHGPFAALKNVDLTIGPGEYVGVVGKSGSGKTTLLNLIAGIDRPTRGAIRVGQTAIERLGEDSLAVWRGAHVGIVFQSFELVPTLTVLDNVMLPMDFAGRLNRGEQSARALQLLESVGVVEHARKLPSAISGGQQQRVAVARALANDPSILLADEPTGNLDSKTADAIFDLFGQLASRGKTVLLVSHDPDLASRVTRTIVLSDGSILDDRSDRGGSNAQLSLE